MFTGEVARRVGANVSATLTNVSSRVANVAQGNRRRMDPNAPPDADDVQILFNSRERYPLTLFSTPNKDALTTSSISVKSGYLSRRNDNGSWTNQFLCVVPHTFLYMFDSESSDVPRSIVDLELFNNVSLDDTVLKVSTGDEEKLRPLYFEDEDPNNLNQWSTSFTRTRYQIVVDERNMFQQMQFEMNDELDSAAIAKKSTEQVKVNLEIELKHSRKAYAEALAVLQSMLVFVGITEEDMARLSDVNKIGIALNNRINEMKSVLEKKYTDSLEAIDEINSQHRVMLDKLEERLREEVRHKEELEQQLHQELQEIEKRAAQSAGEVDLANMNFQVAVTSRTATEGKNAKLKDEKKVLVKEVKQLRKRLDDNDEAMGMLKGLNDRLCNATVSLQEQAREANKTLTELNRINVHLLAIANAADIPEQFHTAVQASRGISFDELQHVVDLLAQNTILMQSILQTNAPNVNAVNNFDDANNNRTYSGEAAGGSSVGGVFYAGSDTGSSGGAAETNTRGSVILGSALTKLTSRLFTAGSGGGAAGGGQLLVDDGRASPVPDRSYGAASYSYSSGASSAGAAGTSSYGLASSSSVGVADVDHDLSYSHYRPATLDTSEENSKMQWESPPNKYQGVRDAADWLMNNNESSAAQSSNSSSSSSKGAAGGIYGGDGGNNTPPPVGRSSSIFKIGSSALSFVGGVASEAAQSLGNSPSTPLSSSSAAAAGQGGAAGGSSDPKESRRSSLGMITSMFSGGAGGGGSSTKERSHSGQLNQDLTGSDLPAPPSSSSGGGAGGGGGDSHYYSVQPFTPFTPVADWSLFDDEEPSAPQLHCLRCEGVVAGPKNSTCKCKVPALTPESLNAGGRSNDSSHSPVPVKTTAGAAAVVDKGLSLLSGLRKSSFLKASTSSSATTSTSTLGTHNRSDDALYEEEGSASTNSTAAAAAPVAPSSTPFVRGPTITLDDYYS